MDNNENYLIHYGTLGDKKVSKITNDELAVGKKYADYFAQTSNISR